MTLPQLTYFCAVCQYRSITRAADALYVSQPAISTAIRHLEEEFHISLFYHGNNRIKLTAEGKNFYKKASTLIKRYQDFYSEFSGREDSPFVIRLGVPAVMSTIFFPDLLHAYHEQYDTGVMLIEARTTRSCRQVKSGEMDAAIVNLDFCDVEAFNSHVILQDHFSYCVHKSSPLAARKELTFEDLLDEQIILLNTDAMLNDLILSRFASMKSSPHIIMHSSQLFTVLRFITEYNAGAFLYHSTPIDDPDIIKIPLSPSISGKIGVIWKKGVYVNHSLNSFLDFIRSYQPSAIMPA